MSEQESSADERTWPTRCPECQTELQTAHQGFNPEGADDIAHGEMDELVAVDFCPNPDCPTNQSEVQRENRPGSLGGDNGGG